MKRVVGIVVIAVFACALFLVPNVSASSCKPVIVDSGVVPSIGDVNDKFTYWVNVTNEGWFPCWDVEVKLTYGPNENNQDCNESRTYYCGISCGENRNITFRNIQLKPLKRCDDEFKKFTDGKKGWRWDNCWYKFEITYLEGHLPPEWGGGPTLTNIFVDFRNGEVSPQSGTNNRSFNYSVEVNASKESPVELLVFNYDSNKYEIKNTTNYTNPMSWQPIEFKDIELSSSELSLRKDGKYIFRYKENNKTSEEVVGYPYRGPFWPIDETWKNPNVEPGRGLYNSKFNYSLDVKAKKEVEVKLLPYYPTKGQASISDDTEKYTDVGRWQTLYWNDTQPFEAEDEGNATYKFLFKYENTPINDTEEHEGKRYEGPYIGIADFENATVEPKIGLKETEFTYSVWVKAVKPDYLTLKVYDSKGDCVAERISKNKTTTEWKLFKFENVPFKVPPAIGIARYVFLTGKETKNSSNGPEIIREEFGKLFVDPREGTNYTLFNFSVEFNTSKPGNVTLWAKCDDGEWEEVESKPVVSETIKFSEKTPCDTFKEVCWKCKGIVSESEINCTNWDIGLNWGNASFSPTKGWWNDTFNFSVVSLSANVPGSVELQVKCKGWKSVGNQSYSYAPNPQILSWENVSICDESYEGNTSYNFTFYWKNTTKYSSPIYYTGPELFIPLNIHLENNTVEPEEGVYYNFKDGHFRDTTNPLFNYSIEVTADKPTSIKLVLIDPCGEKHNITEECKYITPHQSHECSWRMIELASGQAGKWNYTFLYNDTRYGWKTYEKTFAGPEIIAVFENYTLDPESCPFGDLCDVTVCMKGTEAMNVTLEAFNLWPDQMNWTRIEPLKQYEPPGEKCLNWTIDTFEVPFDKLRLIWKVI